MSLPLVNAGLLLDRDGKTGSIAGTIDLSTSRADWGSAGGEAARREATVSSLRELRLDLDRASRENGGGVAACCGERLEPERRLFHRRRALELRRRRFSRTALQELLEFGELGFPTYELSWSVIRSARSLIPAYL